MRIKHQVNVPGSWHVAIHNSEGEGAILLPVACFMVVAKTVPVKDGLENEVETRDEIVAFIVTPPDFTDDGALMPATELGEDMFIALVSPGDEINGSWDEIANARAKESSAADDRADERNKAKEAHALLSPHQLDVLRKLNVSDDHDEGVKLAKAEDLVQLVTLDLIGASRHADKIRWYTTSLGTVVCHLDVPQF